MMNVVSLSWFRTGCKRNRPIEHYERHWDDLLEWFPRIYPKWQLRWHVDEDELSRVKRHCDGLDFVQIEVMPHTDFMSVGHLWRVKPCWDCDVQYCAQNDCDAVPSTREAKCRNEFIELAYDGHVIRDHPDHSGQMMGGLCCWRAEVVRNLFETWDEFINQHEPQDDWQFNQWYLLKAIWNQLGSSTLTHLGNGAKRGPQDNIIIPTTKSKTDLDKRIPIMGGGFDDI